MTRIPTFSSYRRYVRPRALTYFLAASIILWAAWQAWSVGVDRQLKSTDVSTREVRINQTKLEAVTDRLEANGTPRPPVAAPNNIFIVPDASDQPSSD